MGRRVLATILLSSISFSQGNRPETTTLGGPLRLRDQGSFYVNGKVAGPANGETVINQMYVQYWIPETRGAIPPVIMVHGSSHTGKTYETTPDGREGWATYFVRQQIPVYVVDLPGRARAGFDSSAPNKGPITRFSDQSAWVTFRIGPAPFEPYPTTQFPVEARELLPEEGFAGNSHMLMMDRNNLKVADRIIAWLRETVK